MIYSFAKKLVELAGGRREQKKKQLKSQINRRSLPCRSISGPTISFSTIFPAQAVLFFFNLEVDK